MNDSEIVDLYLSRDERAISETADKYGARLRALAMNVLNDACFAEECENDTYMSAWNSIPPNEPRNHFFAFLAKITRNSALDKYRYQNRAMREGALVELGSELQSCLPALEDVEGEYGAKLMGEAIGKFLSSQSSERRTVFMRRYWYMDSIDAIARRYSMSRSKVKSLLLRTRRDLAKHLKKEGLLNE